MMRILRRSKYTLHADGSACDERGKISLRAWNGSNALYAAPGLDEYAGSLIIYASTNGDPVALASLNSSNDLYLWNEIEDDGGEGARADFFPDIEANEEGDFREPIREAIMDLLAEAKIIE